MSRSARLSQAQRSFENPLNLGTFSNTSLRYLKGSFGPENKVIGRADTSFTSNGGFGGGRYNHWYTATIESPAWIIATKGPPRPQYIQVSAYDLNKNPIQGQAIFDADSIQDGLKQNGEIYLPYLDTVMSTQSDLYNQFISYRLDKGDERYYPLQSGKYLICVSTTRNEPLAYELGLIIEFPATEVLFELEDGDGSLWLQENAQGTETPFEQASNFAITCDIADSAYFDGVHDHSLSEWKTAWDRDHQDTDPFPEVFVPLTNRS